MRWKPYSVETQTVIPSPTCRKHETLQMRALISAQHFRSRRYKRPWWRMLLKCGWKLVQDSSNIWMLLPVSSTYGTVGSGSWHLLIIWSSQTCNLMLNRSQSHLPPIQCHPVPLISLTLPRPIIFSTTINLYQSFKKSKHIPPSFVTNTANHSKKNCQGNVVANFPLVYLKVVLFLGDQKTSHLWDQHLPPSSKLG